MRELKLPKIVPDRNKYEAGYVVGFAGSKIYAGSAKLAGMAALRSGAGIVRIFHPEEIGAVPFELIAQNWDLNSWREALCKAQAVFVGPGLGRSEPVIHWLKTHFKEISVPCVVDADALLPDIDFPKQALLTPHRGEALRLLGLKEASQEDLIAHLVSFCEKRQVIVVLKGAPTVIFAPGKEPILIRRGDPGMATAGAGDVLTGVIAALLAQGCALQDAAILGATLHGIAGELAAKEKTSYGLIASDLIDFLPQSLITYSKMVL